MSATSPPRSSTRIVRLAPAGSWDPVDLAERNLRLVYNQELRGLAFELRQANCRLAYYRRAKPPVPSNYPIEAATVKEERARIKRRIRRLERTLASIDDGRREEEAR